MLLRVTPNVTLRDQAIVICQQTLQKEKTVISERRAQRSIWIYFLKTVMPKHLPSTKIILGPQFLAIWIYKAANNLC